MTAARVRPLTPRQAKLLQFLRDFHAQHGKAPTHKEICTGMGQRSVCSAATLLSKLEAKGFTRRVPMQVRGIEILRPAGDE